MKALELKKNTNEIAVASVAILVAALLLYQGINLYLISKRCMTTTGLITAVRKYQYKGSDRYDASYQFRVGKTIYSGNESFIEEPRVRELKVYYDPHDPTTNQLKSDFEPELYFEIAALVFILGIFILVKYVYRPWWL